MSIYGPAFVIWKILLGFSFLFLHRGLLDMGVQYLLSSVLHLCPCMHPNGMYVLVSTTVQTGASSTPLAVDHQDQDRQRCKPRLSGYHADRKPAMIHCLPGS
ncbi:hypothetical protein B0I37DRAFT_219312 [Chaetomium sp. MPI-CAGE-AT-0009]|nr:hypothetical protein B0I37DRAFT_219312 [Chaetomium sp. MPI-CAGE-AT-0009]